MILNEVIKFQKLEVLLGHWTISYARRQDGDDLYWFLSSA